MLARFLLGVICLLFLVGSSEAVARGFSAGVSGGYGRGVTGGFRTGYGAPLNVSRPYNYGWDNYRYPNYYYCPDPYGEFGGTYYFDDSAEQAYNASHYPDGDLVDSDDDDAGPSKPSAPPIPKPTVSEAERLKAADQTYSWGFDKDKNSTSSP